MSNMPFTIVSTCGTSLLTNLARGQKDLSTIVVHNANIKNPQNIPEADRAALETLLQQVRDTLENCNEIKILRNLAAEINGISHLFGTGWPTGQNLHFLISTDTWLGQQTARCVQEWLQRQGEIAEVVTIPDLNTKDILSFQSGLAELLRWCAENLSQFRQKGLKVIFQLSGGFKSVQGFMQTLAHFYADETVYIFEGGDDVLRIPRLPLRMDLQELVAAHFELFSRLAANAPVAASEIPPTLPETLVQIIDDQATLTVWGDLVWDQNGKTLLGQRLRPPPCVKLRYGDHFAQSLGGLSAERIRQINTRVQDLGAYLDSNGTVNPRRLDFKVLRNDSVRPPSTHECDAWADGGARRLFGHYEGGIFVLDSLDDGLH